MNYIVVTVLFIIFINGTQAGIFSYPLCCGNWSAPYAYYFNPFEDIDDPRCMTCYTPQECKHINIVNCTAELAEVTIAKMAEWFPNPRILIDKKGRLSCFAIQGRNLNGKEMDIRGCMFSQSVQRGTPPPIISYTFDFMAFFAKEKRVSVLYNPLSESKETYYANFENYNRTYWNTTHFPQLSCFKCNGYGCNQIISPYREGRILFQRSFKYTSDWKCVEYKEENKKAFHDLCLKDKVIGTSPDRPHSVYGAETYECGKEWDWPEVLYVPKRTNYGNFIVAKA